MVSGIDLDQRWKSFGPNSGQFGLKEVTCLMPHNREWSVDSDYVCMTPATPVISVIGVSIIIQLYECS